MSSPLQTYRVYCFDGARHIVTAELVEAANDAEAVTSAEAAGFGSRCEIWQRDRLVARLAEAGG